MPQHFGRLHLRLILAILVFLLPFSSVAADSVVVYSPDLLFPAGYLEGSQIVSPAMRTPIELFSVRISKITTGGGHTCALTQEGGVKCWGWYAGVGVGVGDGTTESRSVPVDVVGLSSGVMDISAGWAYTCALMSGGGVKCWGAMAKGN
jgi:alpha-tubulin suppressor-like RCC1 family protein